MQLFVNMFWALIYFLKVLFSFYFTCMSVCLYVHQYISIYGSQKRASDPQAVLSLHVGAVSQTGVLWKR